MNQRMSIGVLLALLGIITIVIVLPTIGFSSVPQVINYQGRLTDAEGNPLNGEYTMRFHLFNAETGGTQLWNSPNGEQQTITVTGGIYTVQLGANQPLDSSIFNSGSVWLEIVVEGEILLPRQQITSTAYALKAGDADTLEGDGAAAFAITGPLHDAQYVNEGQTNAITSAMIADDAVTAADLAVNSVGSSEIIDNSLTAADLAVDSVTSHEIAPNAVGSEEIASGAVGMSEIITGGVSSTEVFDNSLTAADLAADSVGTSEVADNSLTAADIASNAVGASELAINSVTSADIVDGSVRTVDLGDDSVTSSKIAANAVTSGEIATDAVRAAEIAANAVGSSEIVDGSVTYLDLVDGTARTEILDDDGEGSSLDADFLDGMNSDEFAATVHTHFSLSALDGNPVNALYTDAYGAVGIGTQTPVDKLEIQGGSLTIDGAEGVAAVRFRQNDDTKWSIFTAPWIGDNDLRIRNDGSATDVMTFDKETGFVGIGTVSPESDLHVVAGRNDSSIIATFRNSSVSKGTSISIDSNLGQDPILYFSEDGETEWSIRSEKYLEFPQFVLRDHHGGGDQVILEIRDVNPYVMYMHGNISPSLDDTYILGKSLRRWHAVYSVDGVFTSSDGRFKDNVNSLGYGLKEIMNLRPVSFQWKKDKEKDRKIGLIAQEVNAQIPEVVDIPETDKGAWGINYSALVPVLIKAIQEQQVQIDALNIRIQELKQTVTGNK